MRVSNANAYFFVADAVINTAKLLTYNKLHIYRTPASSCMIPRAIKQ
jgi:hypothetical protein